MVTGGAGFIGSNLIHHALHSSGVSPTNGCCGEPSWANGLGGDVRILNVDLLTYAGELGNLDGLPAGRSNTHARANVTDAAAMHRLVKAFGPEVIIHLAAESHVDRSIESGTDFVNTNVLGTQVLLDVARRFDVPRIIHVSTDEVYGSIDQGSFTEDAPCRPSSPYSASKAASDLLALAHHRTYGLPILVTRCTNNYGPRQHEEKLIPKIILNALKGERVPIYGAGNNVRNWIYVNDHCAALLHLLRVGKAGEVYNIGGAHEESNLQLARRIVRFLGSPDSLIQLVDDRPGHDFRYSVDDRRIRATGWRPEVSLEEGLDRTIGWYRRHKMAKEAAQ